MKKISSQKKIKLPKKKLLPSQKLLPEKDLFTLSETATFLGVTMGVLRYWIFGLGTLPAVKIVSRVRVRREEILKFREV